MDSKTPVKVSVPNPQTSFKVVVSHFCLEGLFSHSFYSTYLFTMFSRTYLFALLFDTYLCFALEPCHLSHLKYLSHVS